MTLESHCLTTKRLPSLAYGFRSCSQRFKHDPIKRELRTIPAIATAWDGGGRIKQAIGFGVDEMYRMHRRAEQVEAARMSPETAPKRVLMDMRRTEPWYPLIDWGWDRRRCEDACLEYLGLVPPKSSCFFCPAMKPAEIRGLPADIQARALAIEAGAVSTSGHRPKLGRYFAWADVVAADRAQVALFEAPALPCECTS